MIVYTIDAIRHTPSWHLESRYILKKHKRECHGNQNTCLIQCISCCCVLIYQWKHKVQPSQRLSGDWFCSKVKYYFPLLLLLLSFLNKTLTLQEHIPNRKYYSVSIMTELLSSISKLHNIWGSTNCQFYMESPSWTECHHLTFVLNFFPACSSLHVYYVYHTTTMSFLVLMQYVCFPSYTPHWFVIQQPSAFTHNGSIFHDFKISCHIKIFSNV